MEAGVAEDRKSVGGQATLSRVPHLLQQMADFQHPACRIGGHQHIAATATSGL